MSCGRRNEANASNAVPRPHAARKRDRPQRHQDAEPTGPSDGAFGPSAREAPARVEGVTRTVPGPRRRAACPSWAPGVAANNGACPELMSDSSRGASAFVETVNHIFSGRSPGAPPSPSAARSPRGG
ncbi:hypothetical protein GCM10009434_22430 [Brevundimonas olei]